MPYTNYLLDLDGTLIDSFEDVFLAIGTAAIKSGLDPPSRVQLRDSMHLVLEDLVVQLFPDHAVERPAIVADFKKIYDRSGFVHTVLFDGVLDTVRALRERECHLFIATNKRAGATDALLDQLAIGQYMEGVITSDRDVSKRMTKTEMVRALLREHRLDARETVFMGDTQGDLEAARNCDLDFIFASYGYGRPERVDGKGGQVMIVHNFSEVLGL